MANVKISALPSWTGTAADLRWFVMNNSGETETYKYSGYSTSITYGAGTDSIKSVNAAGAAGTNSIAIGKGASATGDDSVSIGDMLGNTTGSRSVVIGRHYQVVGDNMTIVGSGAYAVGQNTIAIGSENASYATGTIVVGNGSRATAQHGITIGNNNERNIGEFSTIIGYNNRIAEAPNYYGGIYNNIISSNSWINNSVNGIGYNTIIGGYGNYITGTTSGTTLIGLNNYTSPLKNDTAYVNNFNVIGGSFEVGSGNTISSTAKNVGVIGDNNNIDGAAGSAQLYIGNGFVSSGFGNYGLHIGNGHYASGTYNFSIGDSSIEQNASYSICVGNSGGAQQHKQWGTDVYNLGVSNQLQGITGGFIFGKNHTISNGGWGGIFAGIGNSISSSGNYNTIIGGESNSITGGTNIAMIGTSGRTADYDETTYVENLKVYRQIYGGIKDLGTIGGTINIDCNEGNTQYFTLSATSAISFASSTIRDGATYILKIKQPAVGNHTASWSVFIKWPNGVVPVLSTTPNAEDILTFVIIGGEIYGNIQKLFS